MTPGSLPDLHLATPEALWLLVLLPLLVLLRERSTAGWPPWRSFGALLGRTATICSLILAMAQPTEEQELPDRAVALVVDASASMAPPNRAAAEEWLRGFWAEAGALQRSVVVAGEGWTVTEDLREALAALRAPSSPKAGTDLGAALEIALAQLPAATSRELVLLTDGGDSRGQLEGPLLVASARDVPVHTVHLQNRLPSIGIVEVTAEQDRRVEEPLLVQAQLEGQGWPREARLELYNSESGELLTSAGLPEGEDGEMRTEIPLRWTPTTPGNYALELRVAGMEDASPWDDHSLLRVRVLPRPTALLVGNSTAQNALGEALSSRNPPLEWIPEDRLPTDFSSTKPSLIALLDPNLERMSRDEAEALAQWTREGGRLIVTGGESGLVTDRPAVEALADLLPIHFPKTKKKEQAPLSVLYCLDSSDSMAGSAKFELAASALAQSLHVLPKEARVGILTFADFPTWVAPLGPIDGTSQLIEGLSQIRIRGGTSIFHALAEAFQALKTDDALLKHVILLSDGQSTTTFSRSGDVVTAMAKRGITVSTIAVSTESDRPEMERISRAGQGRAYYAERFSDLPQLFLDETVLVSRTNKIEDRFEVRPVARARALQALHSPEEIPPIFGYVKGRQKAGSELALATTEGQPLLVTTPRGRGHVAVLTTDLGGPWTRLWEDWDDQDRLWEGIVDAVLRPKSPIRTTLTAKVVRGEARLEYDAVDPLLNPRGDLVVEALIEGPDGSQSAVELEPSGPGRYRLRLPLEPGGATLVRIAAVGTTSESSAAIPASGELVASLAPGLPEEGRAGRENPALLAAISQQTGGLVDPSTKEVAERPAPTHRVPVPRWPWALGAALVALLLDLSWRRIPWPDARSEA